MASLRAPHNIDLLPFTGYINYIHHQIDLLVNELITEDKFAGIMKKLQNNHFW